MLSLSNKFENIDEGFKRSDSNTAGLTYKTSKVRKIRQVRRENENESPRSQEIQSFSKVSEPVDKIKALAASITTSDFQFKPVNEQNRIVSTFDEDSALETVSWAILNTGRISQIKQEIDF